MVKLYGYAVEHAQEDDDAFIFPTGKKEFASLPEKCAERYSTSLIGMWEAWTLYESSEDFQSSGEVKKSEELFKGPCLGEFGNGNYEKILIVAKKGEDIVGHWWSAVSHLCLDPRDGFQSELVEEDFDKELLYKQAQRYI